MSRPRLCCIGTLLATCCVATPALEPVAPVPWAQDDALAWAVVPDLDRLLAQLEETAAVFSPDQAAMLRVQLDAALGVGTLDAVASDGAIAAVLLPGVGGGLQPRWALVVLASDPAPLIAAAERFGLTADDGDDRVVIASDDSVLSQAAALRAAHGGMPERDGDAAIHAGIAVDRIVARYAASARGMLPMMGMMLSGAGDDPEAQQAAQIMHTMAWLGLAALEDVARIDLALKLGAEPRLDQTTTAVADSPLAPALQAPADPDAWRAAWHRLPPGPRLMAYAGSWHTAGWYGYLRHLLDSMGDAPVPGLSIDDDLLASMDRMMQRFGDSGATSLSADPARLMQQSMVMTLSDGDGLLTDLDTVLTAFAGSSLADFYATIDMPLAPELTRAVRAVDDTEVHRMRIFGDVDPADLPGPAADWVRSSMAPVELAVADGWYLAAQHGPDLDAMLASPRDEVAPPRSRTLAADAHGYMDYDYAFQIRAMLASMFDAPLPAAASERPVLIAGATADGAMTTITVVPLAPIRDAFQAMMAGAFAAPGQPAAPAPQPVPQPAESDEESLF